MKKLISLLLALTMALALAVPACAVSGMSNFAEKKDTYTGFGDVPADAWYATALKSCYESKLMQGTSAATFNPLGSLTGAAALVMACRVHMTYTTGDPSPLNVRTEGKPWYWAAYEYALNNGILSKEVVTKFDFSAPITRIQMAYLFDKALPASELKAINIVASVPDVELREDDLGFSDSVYRLYRAGVLSGNDLYGTFAPNSTITRQAACAIIARVAFPEQRKTLDLYTTVSVGDVTFAMPANYTDQPLSELMTQYVSPDETKAAVVWAESDAAYQGVSILTASKEGLQAQLEASAAQSGGTISGLTLTAVKFGATDAYRAVYNLTVSGVQMVCCGYYFISGATQYNVVYSTVSGTAALALLANSVTVGGSGVSVKLG